MSVAALLISRLAQRDVTLKSDGDKVIIDGPDELVTSALVQEIRAAKAEILAELTKAVIIPWLNSHPASSDPAAGCAWCGTPETPDARILPFGIGPHTWLHPDCWGAWDASLRIPIPSDNGCRDG